MNEVDAIEGTLLIDSALFLLTTDMQHFVHHNFSVHFGTLCFVLQI